VILNEEHKPKFIILIGGIMKSLRFYSVLLGIVMLCSNHSFGQNDVMMQAFYWDVPVDATNFNGTWWDNLSGKAAAMKNAGFTGIWVPSPAKGNFGIYDMGYGLFDHYDLGNYNQKGTIETRFGSRSELASMITSMHNNGIEVYADIILNHIYTGDSESENNPAVKNYVFNEAKVNGNQLQSYPTNEIKWVIPNAQPGDYYIQIKGYLLDWGANKSQRGYDLEIDWTGNGFSGNYFWEYEPNNGQGSFNNFTTSGKTVRGHIASTYDIDEYKITLNSQHDIVIKLTAKKEGTNSSGNWEWKWASQNNGYYPVAIWYNHSNLSSSTLQARTNTGVSYPNHTGTGEKNYTWNYTHFHPVDNNDWLGFPGNDEIITNTKFFGNDLNTFNTVVKTRLKDWGVWLSNQIGFDGYRLDFVRGFQESFAADWIKNLPKLNNKQRFIVGEYWGSAYRIKNWVNTLAGYGADADGFDFPLKFTLTSMCNGNQSSFDMKWLKHSGMVKNPDGNALSGTQIVTFLDNHDTGKEHNKWITKDHKMGYAYILTHEGRPCVFYPHYYNVLQKDADNGSHTTQAAASLKTDIDNLIKIRKTYLGGSLAILSDIGNPHPYGYAYHLYVARRQGNGSKDGAIIAINNHDTQEIGLWIDSSPSGFSNWANTTLVNALDNSQTTQVQADGRVFIKAPKRGFAIWVKQSDYVALNKTSDFTPDKTENKLPTKFELGNNYPNPFNPATKISYSIPENGHVKLTIYNSIGEIVDTIVDKEQPQGNYIVDWDATQFASGIYFYRLTWKGKTSVGKMIYVK